MNREKSIKYSLSDFVPNIVKYEYFFNGMIDFREPISDVQTASFMDKK